MHVLSMKVEALSNNLHSSLIEVLYIYLKGGLRLLGRDTEVFALFDNLLEPEAPFQISGI